MTLVIGEALRSFLDARVMFLSHCWKIERTDRVTLRFTDHIAPLVLADGETYSPIGGGDVSAREQETAAKAHNREFTGIISSDLITPGDLKDGKYRNAKITESIVNSIYPWLGALETKIYWIGDINYNGEIWIANVHGLGGLLSVPKGRVHKKTCDWRFCDERCGLNVNDYKKGPLAVYNVGGSYVGQYSSRLVFSTLVGEHLLPEQDNEYYNEGKIEWITAANEENIGTFQTIRNHQTTYLVHYFFLAEPTPKDIVKDDTFKITRGCRKTRDDCKAYNNIINFGGFPDIPGSDKALQTPNSYY